MDVTAAHTPPPLHDLLGVSFVFNVAINALTWDDGVAYFALADGAIAALLAQWPGAPRLAKRPGGGVEIIAAATAPPPPIIVNAHRKAALAIAADPLGGVVSGGADGRYLRLVEGVVTQLAERSNRRIGAVAAGRGGRRAFATGRQVDQLGPDQRRIVTQGRVTSLRYDPSGLHLAIGYEGGISLQACAIREVPTFAAAGGVQTLCWDHAGERVAAALPSNGVALRDRKQKDWQLIDVPDQVTTLCFIDEGSLVIGTNDNVYVWTAITGIQPLRIGYRGQQAVGPAVCHPRLGLIACANCDGAIILVRPGLPDVMVIRDVGSKPTALAFAPSGEALAFATQDSEVGTVLLPDLLFRATPRGLGAIP